jgi:soluble lytic murein transglycosylase-like protein
VPPFTPEELSKIYDDYHATQAQVPVVASTPKYTVEQLSQIYDQFQADNPKPVRGTAGEVAAGGTLNLLSYPTFGFGDEIVAGGSALIDALQGNDFGPAYDQRLNTARDLRTKFRNEVKEMSPTLSIAQDVGGAFLNPLNAMFSLAKAPTAVGRIAKNAAVGAGMSSATAFGEGEGGAKNRLVDALQAGATGGILSGGISGVGEGLSRAAKSIAARFPDWAETEYFTAMGAGKGDLTKSARQDGFTKGPNGELETQLRTALRAVKDGGLLEDSWSPAAVLEKSGNRTVALAKEVQGLIKQTDEARGGIKVYPKFNNAENYIAKQAVATDRPTLRKELDRWRKAIKEEGDGSLEFLQRQKIELGTRTYAGGQKTAEDFEKALTADLRQTIENVSEAALGKNGRTIANVNRELSNFKKTEDVLANQAARSENRSIGDVASTLYKTTGGVMSGLIGGSLIGIGGGPGALLSGLALYSRTPQGRFIVAKALEKTASLASNATSPKGLEKLTPIETAVSRLLPAQRALLIQKMNEPSDSRSNSKGVQGRPIGNSRQKAIVSDPIDQTFEIDRYERTPQPIRKTGLGISSSGENGPLNTLQNSQNFPAVENLSRTLGTDILLLSREAPLPRLEALRKSLQDEGRIGVPEQSYTSKRTPTSPEDSQRSRSQLASVNLSQPNAPRSRSQSQETLSTTARKGSPTLQRDALYSSSPASAPENSRLRSNYNPTSTPKITRENKELFQRVATEAIGKLPPLVQAMVQVESNGKIDAVSKAGAKGLMQLMPENVKKFKVADPFHPLENIRGGMALMREELGRFGDVKLALAAYNAGSPRVQEAIKRARSDKFVDVYQYLPAETQAYVARVLTKLNELEA